MYLIPQFFGFAYILVFLIAIGLSSVKLKTKTEHFFVLACCALLIISNISLDPKTVMDRAGYENFFNVYIERGINALNYLSRVEPSFTAISTVVNFVFGKNATVLFLVFSIIGVYGKFALFKKYSPNLWLSVLVYLSFYFFLHDSIQLRAGAAITFAFWAVFLRIEGKILKSLLFLGLACLFHYSAVVFFAIYVIGTKRPQAGVHVVILVVCLLLPLLGFSLVKLGLLIPVPELTGRLLSYSRTQAYDLSDYLNLPKLIRIGLWLLFLYGGFRAKIDDPVFHFLLKLFLASICLQHLFNDVPVVPTRVSEMLRFSEAFLFAYVPNLLKSPFIGRAFVVTYSALLGAYSVLVLNYATFF